MHMLFAVVMVAQWLNMIRSPVDPHDGVTRIKYATNLPAAVIMIMIVIIIMIIVMVIIMTARWHLQ